MEIILYTISIANGCTMIVYHGAAFCARYRYHMVASYWMHVPYIWRHVTHVATKIESGEFLISREERKTADEPTVSECP